MPDESNSANGTSSLVISYLTLRKCVGILGIAFPIILIVGSLISGSCEEVQTSISSYYHTIMRDIFVGVISAIALFLFAYKGYDNDNIAGNLASVFALGVAFFPTKFDGPFSLCLPNSIDTKIFGTLHFVSAAGFFLVLAYFSLFLFTKSGSSPTPEKLKRNVVYKVCGIVMLLCIVLIGVYLIFLEDKLPALQNHDPVFWLETIALWAFGISWLVKGELLLADN